MKVFAMLARVVLGAGLAWGAVGQAQTISTVAGTGTAGYTTGVDNTATTANLNNPSRVAIDAQGNRFIADTNNHRIRKVTPQGIISTVAGTGAMGYDGDGLPATSSRLKYPQGVAVDAAGNLYIADTSNYRIAKVSASSGTLSTVAGTGLLGGSGDGGLATHANLIFPNSVALDKSGNFYIADSGNYRIRKVTVATGIITTVAGGGTQGYGGDGSLATASVVKLYTPEGVVVDDNGDIYIADTYNHRIRKVTASTGIITTLAGNGTAGYGGDKGNATDAMLNHPSDVAIDDNGDLYVADLANNRIRKITAGAIIDTVAGNGTKGFSGDGGDPVKASLNGASGVAVEEGSFYIADRSNQRIRKVDLVNPQVDMRLSSTPANSEYGQSISLEAQVVGNLPLVAAAGTVTFTLEDGAILCDKTPVNNETAVCPITGLGVGTHTITGKYVSSNGYPNATASLTHIVTAIPAVEMRLFSSPAASKYGEPVSVRAEVIGNLPLTEAMGTVSFMDSNTMLCDKVALSGEVALCSIDSLTVGTHTITGNYMSSNGYPNGMVSLTHEVAKASTDTRITAINPDPSKPGQKATVTVTVESEGSAISGGTVTISDAVGQCVAQLDGNGSGGCTLDKAAIKPGTYTVTAHYAGSELFAASDATPKTRTVKLKP